MDDGLEKVIQLKTQKTWHTHVKNQRFDTSAVTVRSKDLKGISLLL